MCARFTVLSDTPIAARNRRLGHPTLTQQHHLDALALRRRYLPAQRSFQPPHLGFAAFDHLFSPIRWRKRITPRARKIAPDYRPRTPIQAVMEAVSGGEPKRWVHPATSAKASSMEIR